MCRFLRQRQSLCPDHRLRRWIYKTDYIGEMEVSKSQPITIVDEFARVQFLSNRTPQTTDDEASDAFALLSEYRDGSIFIAHYAGNSEWERHPNGDEFVQVISGKTCLILLESGEEIRNDLVEGQILVVPKGIWHRFESSSAVKLMTITPQPTEHQIDRPLGIS